MIRRRDQQQQQKIDHQLDDAGITSADQTNAAAAVGLNLNNWPLLIARRFGQH